MKISTHYLLPLLLLLNSSQVLGAEPSKAQSTEFSIVNTTPTFWKFWDAASGKAENERVQMFLDQVITPNRELYSATVIGGTAFDGDLKSKEAQAAASKYLTNVETYIPRMRSISNEIEHDFAAYAKDFSLTFPKYSPKTTIRFMMSLFSFDGGTRTIDKKTVLLFGIDGIARYHQPDESLKVFFDHELFHQYHDQIDPDLTDDNAPIWTQLWEEGLATYVSRQMNAGSTEAQALMSPGLAAQTQPLLPKIAKELLENADSTDKKEYATFFYGSNGRADLPPRCGYYVGYKIAEQLGNGRSLQQLAEMHGPELKAQILAVLKKMADEH